MSFKESHFILMTGYRQQLAKALYQQGVPYSIVTEKPIKITPPGVDEVLIVAFAQIDKALDDNDLSMIGLRLKNTPSHVIAGTESGVFPAAVLRRIYNARSSSKALLNRCTDKMAMKEYLSEHDIPMAAFVTHRKGITAESLVKNLGLPVVVKDRKNSGGRNVVIVKTVEELRPLLATQRLYEQFIDAAEGSIESFIENGQIIFSSITEYHTNKVANIVPAGYPEAELEAIRTLNTQVIKSLNIKWGLTHLEYYRDKKGQLFGEVALRPPGGYIMELIKCAYDFDPWEVFVQIELGLPVENLPANPVRTCGAVLLHPGEGIVKTVTLPNKTDYPTLSKATIKVTKGDRIKPRDGVGESVGRCFFSADQYDDVSKDISKLCRTNPVEIEQD
ncbi:ATP-grasp domain-containing protein [Marinicella gelatinilytica]|uniref:ATP-grasp domain-containing protein n=1 Tax=Marinicella gelatinilytica TaxID=2996017 RepID=UPI002260D55D|nr:ATP-grasp domain-containing protein [Marinicella gelatinilytica]MCX7545168.1 ATP-grasp domain-containing protein [Marinicella gelatinilytica]